MTLKEFLQTVKTGNPLDTEEIHRFMDEMSDEARRITFELNGTYHTPDEVRALLSRLFCREIDPTLRVFPPFYTDFGKNIHIGKEVFINACCHFQDHGGITLGDGCQIGTTWFSPRLTTASLPKNVKRLIRHRFSSDKMFGSARTQPSCKASPSATTRL